MENVFIHIPRRKEKKRWLLLNHFWEIFHYYSVSVQFSHSVVSNSLWPHNRSTPGPPVHHQLRNLRKLMYIESVMPSNHLILCRPLLLLAFTISLLCCFITVFSKGAGIFYLKGSHAQSFQGLIRFRIEVRFRPCSSRPHKKIWLFGTCTIQHAAASLSVYYGALPLAPPQSHLPSSSLWFCHRTFAHVIYFTWKALPACIHIVPFLLSFKSLLKCHFLIIFFLIS